MVRTPVCCVVVQVCWLPVASRLCRWQLPAAERSVASARHMAGAAPWSPAALLLCLLDACCACLSPFACCIKVSVLLHAAHCIFVRGGMFVVVWLLVVVVCVHIPAGCWLFCCACLAVLPRTCTSSNLPCFSQRCVVVRLLLRPCSQY